MTTPSTVGDTLLLSLNKGLAAAVMFIPNFVVGLVILLIGVILGAIVKRIIVEVLGVLRVESYLKRYGIPEGKKDFSWTGILSEIARWFVIVLFLIPTSDVWGLPRVVTVLNEFLLYLPNVFVAAIIGLVGFVFARLSYDVILASTKEVSAETSQAIATIARWAIIVFVLLAVLNQLGVATDLIRILFTGFVAMIALAGGIAFGLGGQGVAKDLLDVLRKRLR